jgi:hypothetical protein
MFGCSECEMRQRSFFGEQHSVLQCTVCDYGMYLLEFDDSGQGKERLNMCLHRCEDFAHNYVSNPNTMRCEFCGADCSHCSLQYGCVQCASGKQHADPSEYLNFVNASAQTALAPYSFNAFTSFNGPSSLFGTCVDCSKKDIRCDDCR